jgi:hypothetical protein
MLEVAIKSLEVALDPHAITSAVEEEKKQEDGILEQAGGS